MKCIYCQQDTSVINSRPSSGTTRRQRKCKQCQRKFVTIEVLEKQEHPDAEQLIELLKAATLYMNHLQAVIRQIDRTVNQ